MVLAFGLIFLSCLCSSELIIFLPLDFLFHVQFTKAFIIFLKLKQNSSIIGIIFIKQLFPFSFYWSSVTWCKRVFWQQIKLSGLEGWIKRMKANYKLAFPLESLSESCLLFLAILDYSFGAHMDKTIYLGKLTSV